MTFYEELYPVGQKNHFLDIEKGLEEMWSDKKFLKLVKHTCKKEKKVRAQNPWSESIQNFITGHDK